MQGQKVIKKSHKIKKLHLPPSSVPLSQDELQIILGLVESKQFFWVLESYANQ